MLINIKRPVYRTILFAVLSLLLLTVGFAIAAPRAQAQQVDGWISDWAVEEGFSISIDTEGYAFPSALAFVPQPGDAPDDVLYFVNELDGVVKAVSRVQPTALGTVSNASRDVVTSLCYQSNTMYMHSTPETVWSVPLGSR